MTDAEWIRSRYDQLNLIEEKRLTAMCHGQLYQQRMKKAFDKKVKPRVFREGDFVLKKVLSFAPDSRGKWTPNYEGPYVVKRAFSGGALMLTTMDGEDFTRPVNSDAIFVEAVPQTELLLGLFPSTVAKWLILQNLLVVISLLCIFSPSGVVRCRICLFDLSSLSVGFPPVELCGVASTAVRARAYAPFASQLTLGSPADALGILLFPYRFVLVAVLPVVTFCTLIGLFPDISDSLLLQQYPQIFALRHKDLRRLALQLVFPLEV
ncbi:hypothetical protein KIW84_065571 [Lathyrus oleraceus]|uniref:Pol polyprotein n=1 Tax=Pisum sativum TaxID=3888 RepID=A0A9D5A7M8_PEA|nr:hypothetical protein KIW84_065571 [Pisum sativum]